MSHNTSDEIKVGDYVRVVKMDRTAEGWVSSLDRFLGDDGEVIEISDKGWAYVTFGTEAWWFDMQWLEIMEPAEDRQLAECLEEEESLRRKERDVYEHMQERLQECERTNQVLIMDEDELRNLLQPSEGNLSR